MKTADAIGAFGSVRALAEALDITVQAIYDWGDEVPTPRDFQIEVLTKGKVRARADEPGSQEARA